VLVVGSVASLAANVAVAQPTATGRVIAAWPSFALIAAYELLMRQVRRSAATSGKAPLRRPVTKAAAGTCTVGRTGRLSRACTVGPLVVVVVRAWICVGRRGSGRWLTGPGMFAAERARDRCPVRSPRSVRSPGQALRCGG
jgi:hypothetical protein